MQSENNEKSCIVKKEKFDSSEIPYNMSGDQSNHKSTSSSSSRYIKEEIADDRSCIGTHVTDSAGSDPFHNQLANAESTSNCSPPSSIKDVKDILIKTEKQKDTSNAKTEKLSIKNVANNKPKKIRDEKCTCEVCGKTFKRKSYLTVHMKIHSGENYYSCDICSKSFFTKQHLTIHCNAVHAGLKPFKCNLCDVSFGDPSTLAKHKKILHVTCKYCQKVMIKRFLNPHYEEFHSGELPFQCNQCQGKFSSARKLKDHKNNTNSHSGKSFPCNICSKVCFTRVSLNSHLQNYH